MNSRFQISITATGTYAVYDVVKGQKRFEGSHSGAVKAQAQLTSSWAANR